MMVELLRQVLSQPMVDIRQILQDASMSVPATITSPSADETVASSAAAPSFASPASIKKAEELITSKLWMIEKSLRGAAEILCDSITNVGDGEGLSKTPLLSTGRAEMLAMVDRQEDREYLSTVRLQVVQFLQYLQEEMQALSLLPTHPLATLKNSLSIQKLWSQLLDLVVTRRMSCLKDVDHIRQVRYAMTDRAILCYADTVDAML